MWVCLGKRERFESIFLLSNYDKRPELNWHLIALDSTTGERQAIIVVKVPKIVLYIIMHKINIKQMNVIILNIGLENNL